MNTTREMLESIIEASKPKTQAFDTVAEVTRVENGTAWVHIPGGVRETPVKLTINAKAGDTVQVRVSGGRAFMVGNASAPPTDDTVADHAIKETRTVGKAVKQVEKVAEKALNAARGKSKVFHQAIEPTGVLTVGDTWFDTANDYAMYTWNGSAWVLEQFGEDSIATGAVKARHIYAGAVTTDKLDANAITAAMISGKDITGGTFRTELGDSLYFEIDRLFNTDAVLVTPYTPADPEQVYSKLQAQGLFNLILNGDTEVNRSRLVPCIFSAGNRYPNPSEFSGAGKYGWFADKFIYADRHYSHNGKLLSKDDIREAIRGMSASDIGVSGLSAAINDITGVVVLRFESFSFAAGTDTDSTAYHLPAALYPVAPLDLVSTHNGVRFKITAEGHIQPYATTSTSGNTAIRGSFTYIAAFGIS